MKCFLLLVDGLKDLEKNFIEGKEKLYLGKQIYIALLLNTLVMESQNLGLTKPYS
jgi:hypothetical protein